MQKFTVWFLIQWQLETEMYTRKYFKKSVKPETWSNITGKNPGQKWLGADKIHFLFVPL